MSPRTVLITGANSGIGLAASKVIASAGDEFHVIMASRSVEKATAAKSEIEADSSLKGRLSTLQLDVTDKQSIEQAAKAVERDFGHLDALVNNAGVGNTDPDVQTRFRACLETNVTGPAMVAEIFRPLLLKSENPYSVFITSGGGSLTRAADTSREKLPQPPNGNAYQASKAALNMVAVIESTQYPSLKVFTMCPGFVVSNLRGQTEELRSGWGKAKEASTSGETLLDILQGKRDADRGKFVHSEGVYPW